MHTLARVLLVATCLAAALFSHPAGALRSTKVEGHTDPDFIGYQPKKVLVVVVAPTTEIRLQTEERMLGRMAEYGVQASTERQVFPPTRQWTPEQRVEILSRQGFDSTLLVVSGANSTTVIPFATQTYGTANTTGQIHSNGTFNAQTRGASTEYNLVSVRSSAEFSAVLVQNGSGKVIWYGDIVTKAGGTLFVGERGDAKASVKGVIEGLEEGGHLVKKKRR